MTFILLSEMLSKGFFILSLMFVFMSSALCLEISISGAVERECVNSYKEVSESILYVDMEKVFNSHPKTQGHKKEIQDFAKTRKTVMEEMVKEFNSLKDKARNINLRISDAHIAKDDNLVDDLSKQLEMVKSLIKEQKLKITDMSDRTKNEIALMEEKNTASILKDIEFLLKAVSKKYDAAVVLEKQSILTGKCKDITDEIVKMTKDR